MGSLIPARQVVAVVARATRRPRFMGRPYWSTTALDMSLRIAAHIEGRCRLMPWFKVDDTLHSHPKPRKSGLAAIGLWSLAGSYSMNYKTDGFVPDWFVAGWPQGRKLADVLVKTNLWEIGEKDGEAGWFFHDWLHYQPSSDEIEQDRENARERQRKHREKLRKARAEAVDEL